MFSYYMTQRPAMPGTLPREGLTDVKELSPYVIIPSIGKGAYALITYDRKLTDREVDDYELTPL